MQEHFRIPHQRNEPGPVESHREAEPIPHSPSARTWLALGAGLLLSGCGDFASNNPPERPEHSEVLRQFDFGNSFPVDEAHLSEEARTKITADVTAFLDQHNTPETFRDLQIARITIEVSSDERQTKQWGEKGNEALSEARLIELDKLVRDIVTQYAFSDAIPTHVVDAFRRKTFTRRMPAGAWGAGVTPITRLENPSTQALFTEEEVKKLSSTHREELFAQARYAEVVFELPGKDEVETQYDTLVGVMAGYDHVTMLVDHSASMQDDYGRLSMSFGGAYARSGADFSGDTTYVVPFEADADLTDYSSLPAYKVPAYLQNLRLYGSNERVFNSLTEVLDRQDSDPTIHDKRKAVMTLTDEGIQDFSVEGLHSLVARCEQNHVDAYFALIGQDGLITFMDQKGLQYEYDAFVQALDPGRIPLISSEAEKPKWLDEHVKAVRLDQLGNVEFWYPGKDAW